MKKYSTLLILFSIALFSCDKGDECIRGNGNYNIEQKNVEEFNSVSVWGHDYLVYLHMGEPTNNINLEAESNILPVINPIVSLSKLDIQTLEDVCIQPTLPMKIDLYTPNLTNIGLIGNSDITTDSIFSDHFRIFVRGGGHMAATITTDSLVVDAFVGGFIGLYGNAKKGYFNIHDGIMLHSYELKQDSCFLSVGGWSSVTVYAAQYLNVKIDGSATVYYSGDPDTVISQITGTGKLIQQ